MDELDRKQPSGDFLAGLNKCIAVLMLMSIITIVALITAIIVICLPETEEIQEWCSSLECIETSNRLLYDMNESADPCENFYDFVCNGFIAKHLTGDKNYAVTKRNLFILEKKKELAKLVETPLRENAPNFKKILQYMYFRCKNIDLGGHDSFELNYLKYVLEVLGNWPIYDGARWNESNFDTTDVLSNMAILGLQDCLLFQIKILPSFKNYSVNRITLIPPKFSTKMEEIRHEGNVIENKGRYISFLNSFFQAKNIKEAESIFNFEMNLLETTTTNQTTSKEIEIKKLQQIVPQINWKKYFRALLNLNVDETELIQIENFLQLKSFSKLMKNAKKKDIANYLWWRTTELNMVLCLPYYNCLDTMIQELPVSFASIYVRYRFNNTDADIKVREIVRFVKDSVIEIIERNKLMTPNVKSLAIDQIRKIYVSFPYAEELLNDTIMSNYFENLTIERSYFKNILNIRQLEQSYAFSYLRKANRPEDWRKNVEFQFNNRRHPNGIVNPPLLSSDSLLNENRPSYLNFGAIGQLIANQFLRRIFNPDGVASINTIQWDEDTVTMYKNTISCIVNQYGKKYFPGLDVKINGDLTKFENILDNAALIVAYNAYVSWEEEKGTEILLPGVKYTRRQLFWISAANIWCSNWNMKSETAKYFLFNSHFSLEMFRVLIPISNMEEFSRDFNCSLKSSMNPEKKCRVLT